jgi:Cu+-exporting ATPase
VALALPVFMLAMTGDFVQRWSPGSWPLRPVQMVQFLMATPVVFWCGRPFLRLGWRSLTSGALNMYTLIALGVTVAWAYSVAGAFAPQWFPAAMRGIDGGVPVYFEAAAMIVSLLLLGQLVEAGARSQAREAVEALFELAPARARLLRGDGTEREVELATVEPGQKLRVKAGDKVPVDGVVVAGTASIDESMLTGEPMPVTRHPGEPVTGATVNTAGSFVMRAERVGEDTLLAQVIDMVNAAQSSRAPIQRTVDTLAAWLVPLVLVVAALTCLAWYLWGPEPRLNHALVNAVAVLIIGCPGALALATPLSTAVAIGRGAEAGVLLKNAEVLEVMDRVDTLVVDKTGTLTAGMPRVVTVDATAGGDEATVLRTAAGLERESEHPLAQAILLAAREQGMELETPERVATVEGRGVIGVLAGESMLVGNRALMADHGVDVSVLDRRTQALRREAQTVIYVAAGGSLRGIIAIADPVRPASAPAIKALREAEVQVIMVSGDNADTARAVGRELGISDIRAEVPPREKAAVVQALQRQGRTVAMVGDSINDAPALATADVGIALGSGADIAIASADVTLVRGDLRGVLRARRLSSASMHNVRQNLFFAFIYNLLGVPIAAGVLYPAFGVTLSPILAAAAMSLSSVSVAGNALRLRGVGL